MTKLDNIKTVLQYHVDTRITEEQFRGIVNSFTDGVYIELSHVPTGTNLVVVYKGMYDRKKTNKVSLAIIEHTTVKEG